MKLSLTSTVEFVSSFSFFIYNIFCMEIFSFTMEKKLHFFLQLALLLHNFVQSTDLKIESRYRVLLFRDALSLHKRPQCRESLSFIQFSPPTSRTHASSFALHRQFLLCAYMLFHSTAILFAESRGPERGSGGVYSRSVRAEDVEY